MKYLYITRIKLKNVYERIELNKNCVLEKVPAFWLVLHNSKYMSL